MLFYNGDELHCRAHCPKSYHYIGTSMSNKLRKSKKNKPKRPASVTAKKSFRFNRRSAAKLAVFAAMAVPIYFATAAFLNKQEALHNLSVLGERKSVLVQIHDTGCSSCRTLMSSVKSVLREYPNIEYRIADLDTPKGMLFAGKHQMGITSLVHLSPSGKVTKEAGLQSKEEVRIFLDGATRKR
ncbi:MAG: hypothetical protein ACI9J2_001358 [Saprospiraceae bacterium]|jgi:hypothetical protein